MITPYDKLNQPCHEMLFALLYVYKTKHSESLVEKNHAGLLAMLHELTDLFRHTCSVILQRWQLLLLRRKSSSITQGHKLWVCASSLLWPTFLYSVIQQPPVTAYKKHRWKTYSVVQRGLNLHMEKAGVDDCVKHALYPGDHVKNTIRSFRYEDMLRIIPLKGEA